MYPLNAPRSCVFSLLALLMTGPLAWAQSGSEPAAPRAHLGILLGLAEEGATGIVVREVTPDSPAAKAGVKKGDRIVKLDDQEIPNIETFFRTITPKKPGDKFNLVVLRDGKEQSLSVTLGERPARETPAILGGPGQRRPAFLGVQTLALTPEMKQKLNVEVEAGAVVAEVVPHSPAATTGLKRDDVITGFEDQTIKTPKALRNAIQKTEPGKEVTLQVFRGKEKLTIKAKLKETEFGNFLPPGEAWNRTLGAETILEQARRIRELERRIEELEKRLRAVEKK